MAKNHNCTQQLSAQQIAANSTFTYVIDCEDKERLDLFFRYSWGATDAVTTGISVKYAAGTTLDANAGTQLFADDTTDVTTGFSQPGTGLVSQYQKTHMVDIPTQSLGKYIQLQITNNDLSHAMTLDLFVDYGGKG